MEKVSTISTQSSKAEKKDLKAARKAELERREKQNKADAELLVVKLAGNSDAIKARGVRHDVKDELKEMYKKGEISKDVYNEAKDYSKKGNWFRRIWGSPKESTRLFKQEAAGNKVEQIKADGGPKFDKKLQAKINEAGITNDELYEIYDRNVGSDNTVSYSWKKRQPGEADGLKAELNSEYYNGSKDVQFSKKEAKQIAKQMGYNVEKAVDYGKVTRDVLTGGAAGTPLAFAGASASSGVGTAVGATAKVTLGAFAPAATAAAGGVISAAVQATRVEKKAAEKILPENVLTYDDYAKYVDNSSNKKDAETMKKIAKFYTKKDGTLHWTQFEQALQKAAGENSVLNPDEALGLYSDLVKNPPKFKEVEPVEITIVEPKCLIKETEETKQVEHKVPTEGYKIKAGDNWNEVVNGKYKPANNDDRKLLIRFLKDAAFEDMKKNGTLPAGVTSSKDGFFPKVGATLELPETIVLPNGKTYKYQKAGKVNAGDLGGKTSVYNQKNPFTEIVDETTYGYNTSCGDRKQGLTKEQRDKKVKEMIDSGNYEMYK